MSPETQFHIICDEEKKRLDIYLSEKLAIARTKVKNMIEDGHVRIEGIAPKPSSKIKNLMEIVGEIPEESPLNLEPQEIPLDIVYEDEYFLAVNKPKGMVVHPSFGHKEGTLVNAVLAYLGKHGSESGGQGPEIQNPKPKTQNYVSATNRPGIVHRLDKDTTGAILVAKDTKTQEMLSSLFKERNVHKTYRAVVEGEAKKDDGVIEGNIGRHPIDRKKMAVLKEGGRKAFTAFGILKRLDGFTYIEAYPKTGRTHQIRVHLAHIGHPVVGDGVYGRGAKHTAERTLLHAYRIEFVHPFKQTPVLIEAPIPDDIEEFIEKYRKKP